MQTQEDKRASRQNAAHWRVLVVCAAVLVVSLGYLALQGWQARQNRLRNEGLAGLALATATPTATAQPTQTPKPTATPRASATAGKTASPAKTATATPSPTPRPLLVDSGMQALLDINPDTVGWIHIPDTNIDYAVVQGADNAFYLDHDFYGNASRYGTIYADMRTRLEVPSQNTILYGHNMKDGQMFHNLRLYKEESFYKTHRFIYLNTLYGQETYEIFGVYVMDLQAKEATTYFFDVVEGDVTPLLDEAQTHALYRTSVQATAQDQLLTLVTCTYEYDDARLIVLAKRIQ